jgi:hypothetical protein
MALFLKERGALPQNEKKFCGFPAELGWFDARRVKAASLLKSAGTRLATVR